MIGALTDNNGMASSSVSQYNGEMEWIKAMSVYYEKCGVFEWYDLEMEWLIKIMEFYQTVMEVEYQYWAVYFIIGICIFIETIVSYISYIDSSIMAIQFENHRFDGLTVNHKPCHVFKVINIKMNGIETRAIIGYFDGRNYIGMDIINQCGIHLNRYFEKTAKLYFPQEETQL